MSRPFTPLGSAIPSERQRHGDWTNHIEIVWKDPFATSGYSQAALMPDGRMGRRSTHKITVESFPRLRAVIVKGIGTEPSTEARSLAHYYALHIAPEIGCGYDGDITRAADLISRSDSLMDHMPSATDEHKRLGPLGLVLAAAGINCPACDLTPPFGDKSTCTEYGTLTVKVPSGIFSRTPSIIADIAAEWNLGNQMARDAIRRFLAE